MDAGSLLGASPASGAASGNSSSALFGALSSGAWGWATPGRLGRLAVAGGVCLLQGSDGWAERPMPAAGGRRS